MGDGVTLVSSADESVEDVYRVPDDRGPARAEATARARDALDRDALDKALT